MSKPQNIEEIKAEYEAKLAQAEEKAKQVGFTVVVFEKDSDELKEIKVQAHELTEKSKADIMQAAAKLGDNFEEIQELSKTLDATVGPWLKFMALIDDPLKEIISGMLNLDKEIVATLPNIELLGHIFGDNHWINKKAKNLAAELKYISNQNR